MIMELKRKLKGELKGELKGTNEYVLSLNSH